IYQIVLGYGNLGKAILDGFTITKGFAWPSFPEDREINVLGQYVNRNNGGGVAIANAGSELKLENLKITHHFGGNIGGGMYISGASNILILNSEITDNNGNGGGGGVALDGNCSPTFVNTKIYNNK